MIEAEQLKAHLASIQEIEEQDKAEIEEVMREAEAEKRAELIKDLPEEPKTGASISVAFRLPDGKRLTRSFLLDHPIKVSCSPNISICLATYTRAIMQNYAEMSSCFMIIRQWRSRRKILIKVLRISSKKATDSLSLFKTKATN